MEQASGISEFYKNRDIFITGVTGFVGKVLLEKLLRTCDVGRVFVLVRMKKGLDSETRKKELLKSKVFEHLKERKPQVLDKVHCVPGNLLEEKLGMHTKERLMLAENVSIVFHLAASVKFEEPLRDSFYNNVEATKQVADLCRQMPNLVAFVHVSTAYCNCEKFHVDEKVYPLSTTYNSLSKLLESNDDILVEQSAPTLFEGRPNAYTFTKAIAENMLAEKYHDLPLVIARPAIISSSWKDPLPGWVDSVNGVTGLVAGAMKGIVRTMLVHEEKVADIVPVDVVVNMLIAVAWDVGSQTKSRSKEVEVYHCSSGTMKNSVTWGYLLRILYPLVWRYPSQKVFIYPYGSFKRNPLWNEICILRDHHFPACIADLMLFLVGKRPKLMKLYTRVHKAMGALRYFSTREWRFHSINRLHLLEKMSEEDKKEFDFDMTNVKWEEYLKNFVYGTRRYLFKEDDSTIPEARRSIKRRYFIGLGIRAAIIVGLVHCFFASRLVTNLLT